MKLSDMLNQGTILFNKKAKLKKRIKLDNGESRKKGFVVSVLMKNSDGTYHVEDNDFACKVSSDEIEFI